MIETLSLNHPATLLINNMIAKANEMKLKYVNQKPCMITDSDEMMAICWTCGAGIDFRTEKDSKGNYKLIMTTKEPVGAIWDGKKFVLHTIAQLKAASDA